MNPHDRRMDARWTELLGSVKAFVNAGEANLDNGERCRNTWECYAFLRWTDGQLASFYETSLVDPACENVCRRLSDSDVLALLTWQWEEYLWGNDPGVESPQQMSPEERRTALVDVLREAVYMEADSDGSEVEERQWFSEDEDDE